jgi:hypothetical protein
MLIGYSWLRGLPVNISSFCKNFISFNASEISEMRRRALFHAIPFVPFFVSLSEVFHQVNPQISWNDDVNNNGENFVFTDSKERTGRIVDLYLQRRVKIINNLSKVDQKELQSNVTERLKSQIVENCHNRMQKIAKIAEDFGLKKVDFGFRLPKVFSEVDADYFAVGTRFSCLSPPVIFCRPPDCNISIGSDHGKMQVPELTPDEEFTLVHEIVHIAKSHAIISLICSIAFSYFSMAIWWPVVEHSLLALKGRVSIGLIIPKVLGILSASFVYQLFTNSLNRCQEKEADCEAMAYLQSNEGALALFEPLEKAGGAVVDLAHPSLKERIAYCRAMFLPNNK